MIAMTIFIDTLRLARLSRGCYGPERRIPACERRLESLAIKGRAIFESWAKQRFHVRNRPNASECQANKPRLLI